MKQMLKNVVVGAAATAMMISVGASGALAAGPGNGRNFADSGRGRVCDYPEPACRCLDADRKESVILDLM